jgi:hypothetical protein
MRKIAIWAIHVTIILAGVSILFAIHGISSVSTWFADQVGLMSFTSALAEAFIVAGIIGVTYELAIRSITTRHYDKLLADCTVRVTEVVQQESAKVLQEIPKALVTDIGVKLLTIEECKAALSVLLERLLGSSTLCNALYEIIVDQALLGGETIWKDTRHFMTIKEFQEPNFQDLLAVTNEISYIGHLGESFTVGFFRSVDAYRTESTKRQIDAYWISPRSFTALDERPNSNVCRVLRFEVGEGEERQLTVAPQVTATQDRRILEFEIPKYLRGRTTRISYVLVFATNNRFPVLQVILPNASEGLQVTVISKVPNRAEIITRIFAPRSGRVDVARPELGRVEVKSSRVLLRGHGVVFMLR